MSPSFCLCLPSEQTAKHMKKPIYWAKCKRWGDVMLSGQRADRRKRECIGEKMWKVRAQFKWCADQNYGFEVWSKGLPACNQRCDNRWAHRKMSNYEHNNNEWMATTTQQQHQEYDVKKMHEVRPKEHTTVHSINVYIYETKSRVCVRLVPTVFFSERACVPDFSSILFIISLSVSVEMCAVFARWFFRSLFSSFGR